MDYSVVDVEEKYVTGLKIRTTNENWKCLEDMGNLWQKFMTENIPGSIENKQGTSSYGLYNNYESDLSKPYDYTTGVEIGSPSSGFTVERIPSGKYAKFEGKGNVRQVVGELWQIIWKTDLKRKYTVDFEMYMNDSSDMNNQTVAIYISIN